VDGTRLGPPVPTKHGIPCQIGANGNHIIYVKE
jgi:hypothetical protein